MTGRDTGGYQLPAVIAPPDYKCIVLRVPNDAAYIRAVWGQLFELARWSAWERDDLRQGTLAAQVWQDYYRWAMACWEDSSLSDCDFCCQEELDLLAAILEKLGELDELQGQVTVNNTQVINNSTTTIYNTYLGDPLDVHVDLPDTTYTEDTGDMPIDVLRRRAALCHAIDVYLGTILEVHEQVFGATVTLLEVIAAGLVVTGAAIPGLLVALGTIIADQYTDAIFADEDARQELRCCMYNSLVDADPTDWPAFRDSLQACGFTPPSHDSTMAGWCDASNHMRPNHALFLSFLGPLWALAQLDLIAGIDRCNCEDVPAACWDFDQGSRQGWEDAEGTPFEVFLDQPDTGQIFSDLVGGVNSWSLGSWGSGSNLSVYVVLPGVVDVDRIALQVWFSGLSVLRPFWVKLYDATGAFLWQRTGNAAGGEGWWQLDEGTGGVEGVGVISVHFDTAWRASMDMFKINDAGIAACP